MADLIRRWSDKLAELDRLISAYDALPLATPDSQRIEALQRAERQISTQLTTPPPATAVAYRNALTTKRDAFVTRLGEFAALLTPNTASLATLLDGLRPLLPVTDRDAQPFTLEEDEQQIVAFATDLVSLAKNLAAEVLKRRNTAQAQVTVHDNTAQAGHRVQALQNAAQAIFGDEFRLIPTFTLPPERGNEWEKALTDSQSGLLFNHLAAHHDFPVDNWLSGIARVREKMHHWEQVTLLNDAFGLGEPVLQPVQLPYNANDAWLALEFPSAYTFDGDRLLYTAHYAVPFQKTQPHCGLLLDEWSEVLPARAETTGITFHYDRPSSEPPQTMLLVTPTDSEHGWQWQGLVETLHETLDLARQRAVEPQQVDDTPYAWLLPATVMAATLYQISITTNLARNNNVYAFLRRE